MSLQLSDITHQVGMTERHGVGPRRSAHPIYTHFLPPCNHACPAGENIQSWLAHAQAGDFERAWRVLTKDNPMPAIHGRVCYHPCESACNRVELDSAVSIHAIERFLGDLALKNRWQVEPAPASGKQVLVVGAGPSGLSAAWHLALLGHAVEIRDAGPAAGGMLHFGIPAYRLPRDILAAEVARIESLGVKMTLNHTVSNVIDERDAGGFDAVYLAIGAQVGHHIDLPARDASRIVDALDLLRQSGSGETPQLGRRVVIYGGGNTAMDAARTAKRLGAEEAIVVYRRDREHMKAHDFEADEAMNEGIRFRWLSTIKETAGTELTIEKMAIDATGKLSPTGDYETLDADTVVLAVGQDTDVDFLRAVPGIEFGSDGTVLIGEDMQTGHDGIFAGGDVTPATRSVTNATGLGKRAARNIDAWLAGGKWQRPPRPELIHLKDMHLPIYDDALLAREPEIAADARQGFDEVVGTIEAPAARHEAARCLSCGNCYECDQCYAACPSDAIIKLGVGKGYAVNLSLCTGCRACFEQCPCHAIMMVDENPDAPAAEAAV